MSVDVAAPFREHERLLRGLCYRLTGSAADADDLVQETFLRALERPPARTDEPWKPWLVRVAVNLGRDALRKRRRLAYVGPWLPSPIEIEEPIPSFEIAGEGGTEGRYDLLESVSFAFLLALEALTPQQRAVLLLRDVFDYSVEETADALALSASNVKTTHHRARRALAPYEQNRCRPTPDLVARSTEALQRFLTSLMMDDVAAVQAQLAEGVVALNDGGGQFFAARRPVVGAAKVAKLNLGIKDLGPPVSRWEIRSLNGLPALVAERDGATAKDAPRFVLRVDIDAEGRISALHTILATSKLTAVRAIAVLSPGAS
jgi:RNA polymerase sigma-70 factor (ECF subfamily)